MDDYGGNYNNVLIPCDVCGRKFAQEAMSRHRPICAKTAAKQRKIFDSSKQRAEGTELAQMRRKGGAPRRTDPSTKDPRLARPAASLRSQNEPPVKKNNWRAKHEDFINTIRAARGIKVAMERGGPLPPPPPPSLNPDYIQCDYCGRRFNESAAQRHINFCKEQHERLPRGGNQFSGSQKPSMRTPAPKLKKAPAGGGRSQGYDDYPDGDLYGGDSRYSSGGGGRGAPPSRAAVSNGSVRGGAPARMGGSTMKTTMGSGYGNNRLASPGSGEALRTGRTAQTYDEARQLSAKQRATMGTQSKRVMSNDSIYKDRDSPQYTGTGYPPSGYGTTGGGGYGTTGGGGYSKSGGSTRAVPPGGRQETYNPPGRYNAPAPGVRGGRGTTVARGPSNDFANRFCLDCGSKYQTPTAKFCGDCGAKK